MAYQTLATRARVRLPNQSDQKYSTYSTVMSREHWHAGSRSDYITALALSRSHAERQGRVHSRPRHDVHMPKHLRPSAIPDLRFEPTYLAKLATAGPGWQSVVWVTVRDQVISPLLQGALWCVRVLLVSRPYSNCLTWLVQGHRVHLHTALVMALYLVAVSTSHFTVPEGR